MDFKLLLIFILSWVSAHPSVDRYITELPSHWSYDMVADQPHVPIRPSSYIYQIDDPSANYIYSAKSKFWGNEDHTSYAKQSGSDLSSSTPTHRHRPKSAWYFDSYSSTPSMGMTVSLVPVITHKVTYHYIYKPVIRRFLPWYPSNYEYYAGNVYTTPYEFSGYGSTFVPNVLYSPYLTYSKPVYVVNYPYNGHVIPSFAYEYPKTTHQQPVHGDDDASKIQNNTDGAEVKIPIKKPIRTNLTEINIDPATEAKGAFGVQSRRDAIVTIDYDYDVIHKKRPNYYNTYGVIYHKMPLKTPISEPNWR